VLQTAVNAVCGQCLLILHGQNLKFGVAAVQAVALAVANKVVNQAEQVHMLAEQFELLPDKHLRSAQADQLAAIVHVKHLQDFRHMHVMQAQLRVHYAYVHQAALADLLSVLFPFKVVITALLVFAVQLVVAILQFADQLVQAIIQVADITHGTLHLNQHMLAAD